MQVPSIGSQHLIGHPQMRITKLVRGLRELLDSTQIVFKFPNRKRNTYFHSVP